MGFRIEAPKQDGNARFDTLKVNLNENNSATRVVVADDQGNFYYGAGGAGSAGTNGSSGTSGANGAPGTNGSSGTSGTGFNAIADPLQGRVLLSDGSTNSASASANLFYDTGSSVFQITGSTEITSELKVRDYLRVIRNDGQIRIGHNGTYNLISSTNSTETATAPLYFFTNGVDFLNGDLTSIRSLTATSINAPAITGSLQGTSSWAENSISSSYAPNIYNSDGTLTGNRTITSNGNNFVLSSTKSSGSAFTINHLQTSPNSTETEDIALYLNYNLSASSATNQLVTRAFQLSVINNLQGGGAVQNLRCFNLAAFVRAGATVSDSLDLIYLERGAVTGTVANYRAMRVANYLGTNRAGITFAAIGGTNATYLNLGSIVIPSGFWGVYQSEATYNNYFNGNVSIKTPLSDLANLQVQGNVWALSYTGSLQGTSSWATNSITASYALNAATGSAFPFSGSAVITGSLLISGSGLTVTGSSLFTRGLGNFIELESTSSGNRPYIRFFDSGFADLRIYSVPGETYGSVLFGNGFALNNISTSNHATLIASKIAAVSGSLVATNVGGDAQVNIASPNGYSNYISFRENGVADRGIIGYANGTNFLQIRTNGATSMTTGDLAVVVDNTGSVAIGLTAATAKLDVNGSGNFRGSSLKIENGAIELGVDGGNRYLKTNLNPLRFFIGSQLEGFFTAGLFQYRNKIGIGTLADGNSVIHLSSSLSTPITSTNGAEISFTPQVNHQPTYGVVRIADFAYGGSPTVSHLAIYSGQNTTTNAYGDVILQHDGTTARGRVAIGKLSPNATFDVSGTAIITGSLVISGSTSTYSIDATGSSRLTTLHVQNIKNPLGPGGNGIVDIFGTGNPGTNAYQKLSIFAGGSPYSTVLQTSGDGGGSRGMLLSAAGPGGEIYFSTSDTNKWLISGTYNTSGSGHIFPVGDNLYNIGNPANKVANYYGVRSYISNLLVVTGSAIITGSAGITGSLSITGSGLKLENSTLLGNNGGQIEIKQTGANSAYIGMQGAGWNALGMWGVNRFTTSSIADLRILGTGEVNVTNRLLVNTTAQSTYLLDVNGLSNISGRLDVTGSINVTGSVTATQGFTGSLFGTSSWSTNSITASSADNFTVRGTLTAQTIVAQVITSSTDFVTGSTRFGSLLSDTHQFTGSVSVTGSLGVVGNTTSNVYYTNHGASSVNLLVSGQTSQTSDRGIYIGSGTFNNASVVGVGIGSLINLGTGTGNVAIGYTAAASSGGVAIGSPAGVGATSDGGVALSGTTSNSARFAVMGSATAAGSISISSTVSQLNGIGIGVASSVSAQYAIALGDRAVVGTSHTNSIAIGLFATTTAAKQLVIGGNDGSNNYAITDVYIGGGVQDLNLSNGTSVTINATGGNGTDKTGGNITIAGGKGTGTGTPGDIILSTATSTTTGTTLQSLTQRVWVKGNTGHVGIDNTLPSTILTVGNTSADNGGITVLANNTSDTYDVFSGQRKYPRITLIDSISGGSTFQIWNLGNQLRLGTNAGSAETSAISINSGTSGSVIFNGDVGIKQSSPSYVLDVTGTIRATGDVIAYSDARVKDNVETIENALEKVNALRGVSYIRKDTDDKSRKLGVIAQELLPIIPEVVSKDQHGNYSVSYGNMVGLLIEAIKEQQKQIDELKYLLKNK